MPEGRLALDWLLHKPQLKAKEGNRTTANLGTCTPYTVYLQTSRAKGRPRIIIQELHTSNVMIWSQAYLYIVLLGIFVRSMLN